MKAHFATTVGKLAKLSGGSLLCGDPSASIGTISTDSRDLGSKSFFVPLKGEKFDGHDFIPGLLREGRLAGFLTARRELAAAAESAGAAAVFCDDTLASYGKIARGHRAEMKATVVGITGTNGKTTTKEILSALLASKYCCHKNEKNYNNEIGVPHALLGLREEHQFSVIEMGMNHAGEIERLSHIAAPDIAVITSVGAGHLEFLGTVENVARAKSEIMAGMREGGLVIINAETQYADLLIGLARKRSLAVMTFALEKAADIIPDSFSIDLEGITLVYRGDEYRAPLYGLHNAGNLLAAVALARHLGVDSNSIWQALHSFKSVGMRSEIIDSGFIIINDTYNSNPLSAESALASVARVAGKARKIAVLSDMKELGDDAPRFHRELGAKAAAAGFTALYTWGGLAEEIFRGGRGAGMAAEHFAKKEDLVGALKEFLGKGDIVLIKGSRSMKMEEVVDALVRR
jgi:UDP-N-acetylmuramoyl-tripeptide--D-alanyl-D-alanine ligase